MIDLGLLDCPLCGSFQVSRWSVGRTVQCNACGCSAPDYSWQHRIPPKSQPAMDWKLSDSAKEQIAEIERHIVGPKP